MSNQKAAQLKCRNLQQYLCSLPSSLLDSLYEHPATCMAVFRELPELAKYYVMRTLFVEQPITKTAAASWVAHNAKPIHEEAVKAMCDLKIWSEFQVQGATVSSYTMSRTFRTNLQKAIAGGGETWANTEHLGPDKHAKSKEDLEKYCTERWGVLLQFLVQSSAAISQDIKDVILFSGLMSQDSNEVGLSITSKGFQFLLLDRASQVWFFVLEYLSWVREQGLNLVSILRFIFEISFTPVGKDLPIESRDDHVMKCLSHFREIGLLLLRKSISRRFYPTQLASNLVNGLTHADKSLEGEGFIVAETNYRVYAYTDSELQFRILSLFCEMMYRLVTSSSIVMISLMSSQQIPKSLRNANHSRKCTNSGCKWDNSRSNLTLHPSKCSC